MIERAVNGRYASLFLKAKQIQDPDVAAITKIVLRSLYCVCENAQAQKCTLQRKANTSLEPEDAAKIGQIIDRLTTDMRVAVLHKLLAHFSYRDVQSMTSASTKDHARDLRAASVLHNIRAKTIPDGIRSAIRQLSSHWRFREEAGDEIHFESFPLSGEVACALSRQLQQYSTDDVRSLPLHYLLVDQLLWARSLPQTSSKSPVTFRHSPQTTTAQPTTPVPVHLLSTQVVVGAALPQMGAVATPHPLPSTPIPQLLNVQGENDALTPEVVGAVQAAVERLQDFRHPACCKAQDAVSFSETQLPADAASLRGAKGFDEYMQFACLDSEHMRQFQHQLQRRIEQGAVSLFDAIRAAGYCPRSEKQNGNTDFSDQAEADLRDYLSYIMSVSLYLCDQLRTGMREAGDPITSRTIMRIDESVGQSLFITYVRDRFRLFQSLAPSTDDTVEEIGSRQKDWEMQQSSIKGIFRCLDCLIASQPPPFILQRLQTVRQSMINMWAIHLYANRYKFPPTFDTAKLQIEGLPERIPHRVEHIVLTCDKEQQPLYASACSISPNFDNFFRIVISFTGHPSQTNCQQTAMFIHRNKGSVCHTGNCVIPLEHLFGKDHYLQPAVQFATNKAQEQLACVQDIIQHPEMHEIQGLIVRSNASLRVLSRIAPSQMDASLLLSLREMPDVSHLLDERDITHGPLRRENMSPLVSALLPPEEMVEVPLRLSVEEAEEDIAQTSEMTSNDLLVLDPAVKGKLLRSLFRLYPDPIPLEEFDELLSFCGGTIERGDRHYCVHGPQGKYTLPSAPLREGQIHRHIVVKCFEQAGLVDNLIRKLTELFERGKRAGIITPP